MDAQDIVQGLTLLGVGGQDILQGLTLMGVGGLFQRLFALERRLTHLEGLIAATTHKGTTAT